MNNIFFVFAVLLSVAGFSCGANAETVTATQNAHLRAGPDKDYPVVETVTKGERVELRGCEPNYGWCEVRTIENEYGWIRSQYLRLDRDGRSVTIIESKDDGGVHITIFKYPDYWDSHYRGKHFYRHYGEHQTQKPVRMPKPAKEKPEPKYKKNILPESSGYNPLCRMGQNEC